MAATHYSIRRQAAIEYAKRYLAMDPLPKEVQAVVNEFARSESIKQPWAGEVLAAMLKPYRKPWWGL